jgi:hypothetical protein
MQTLKVDNHWSKPGNFTGSVEHPSGNKRWFLNGKRHRVDGPAVEHAGGYKLWYLNGESMTEEEHTRRTAYLRTTLGKLIFNKKTKVI